MRLSPRRFLLVLLACTVAVCLYSPAVAQIDEDHKVDDYSTTPLIQPTVEDFAPAPEIGGDGFVAPSAPIGVNGYFEVSDKQKIFSLTPSYRFSEKFTMKGRIPYVVERTRTYFNGEETASGLGDIGLDGEYTHRFSGPSKLLRFQGTVKLPTGDHENIEGEDEVKIPLGTGSIDFMLRGQFTRSTAKTGFLASAMFRKNAKGEAVFIREIFAGNSETSTVNTTNGHEFVASAFGRYMFGKGFWFNLGGSLMVTGNGDSDTHTTDTTGGDWSYDSELVQKSTLLDIYPGVSYKFGPVTPYLGARIPVSTSYDNEFLEEERDTVFIFQLTYRPLAMMD
ncbi:MAG: hypothetical protein GY780_11210 [bacterium]|nr:hypothetical protein [bacterium]